MASLWPTGITFVAGDCRYACMGPFTIKTVAADVLAQAHRIYRTRCR